MSDLERRTVCHRPDDNGCEPSPERPLATYRGLQSRSAAMHALFSQLKRLESSTAAVVLEGESGTGKELVARAIHEGSPTAHGPFVAVNCGALDSALVKSELFGHKRGAFTGAIQDQLGAIEAAAGGTLLLDEIGELPDEIQPLLLRTLELGVIKRIGDHTERSVRFRVIAATHRDLREQVRCGRFRQDLFYRLMVVRLHLPPLRDRREDIALLANQFLAEMGGPELASELFRDLRSRPWPGNIRQLKNWVQAYAALGAGSAAGERDDDNNNNNNNNSNGFVAALGTYVDLARPYAEQKERVLAAFTEVYLQCLLRRTHGNRTQAARISGLERSYICKLAGKYGIALRADSAALANACVRRSAPSIGSPVVGRSFSDP